MIIRLLGTGAAEGIPAFYSDSRVSKHARCKGGKDVRTRSAALIDGHIKIDLPPDTLMQLNRDRLDARDWTCLWFTHGHDDHFAPAEIQYGLYPFNEMEHLGFTIYGNASICDRIWEMYPHWPLEVIPTESFRSVQHMSYRVTPISANHKDDEDSQNLIFEHGGKTLLYATDTGVWEERTWEYLRDFKIDLLVIECTSGFISSDYTGHLTVKDVLEVRNRLAAQGSIGAGSRVVTTHHSHNGDATHEDLENMLVPEGIDVGYDGLEITI